MTKVERAAKALEQVPPAEKARIIAAFRRIQGAGSVSEWQALSVALDVVLARERTRRKREKDKENDAARRILVGARVPRDFYERCKKDAETRGLSLYAWVIAALQRAIEGPLW